MNLAFIYGPPGVGKLTAAREPARPTGHRLFDSLDTPRELFGRYDLLSAARGRESLEADDRRARPA